MHEDASLIELEIILALELQIIVILPSSIS